MALRQKGPRVNITYPVPPIRKLGIGVDGAFNSDDREDAAVWGNAVAESIRARVVGSPAAPADTVLVVELFCGETQPRYRGLLAFAVRRAVEGLVGNLFAAVFCETHD